MPVIKSLTTKLNAKKKSVSASTAASRKNANKLRDYFGSPQPATIKEEKSESEAANKELPTATITADVFKISSKKGVTAAAAAAAKKRKGCFVGAGGGGGEIEREISVATVKKLKSMVSKSASAYLESQHLDSSSLFNVDYSSQSQLVFEITCDDGLRVISYDINRNIFPQTLFFSSVSFRILTTFKKINKQKLGRLYSRGCAR